MPGGKKLLDLAKSIIAYHSSPHVFDKFDISRIGTGEGNQTYGHGLYFAENPSVSDRGGDYWRQFFNKMKPGPEHSATAALYYNKFDRDAAAAALNKTREYHLDQAIPGRYGHGSDVEEGNRLLADQYERAAEMIRSGQHVGPATYQVRIHADPEHFLDWDKELGEQPAIVERLRDHGDLVSPFGDNFHSLRHWHKGVPDQYSGRRMYDELAKGVGLGEEGASKYLHEAGVPGVKYLDAGSRGAGDGTRNYVTFSHEPVEILKRYGAGGKAIEQALKVAQKISSADTSIKQVPALFRSKHFEALPEGHRNIDIGGGRYDLGTEALRERGVESHVYDPFNRPPEHNESVLARFRDDPAHSATVANVLNVIAEPEARAAVVQQALDLLRPGGKAYFGIYEGDKSGVGRATSKGWQENRPAASYLDEIRALFPGAERRGNIIVAPKATRQYPIAPRGEWYGDANYETTGGRMVNMAPDEFLSHARPMNIDDVARENIDDLKAHIEGGRTLDPLALYGNGREDGRHRAHAAKELGIDSVPVLNFRDMKAEGGALLEDEYPTHYLPNVGRQVMRDGGAPGLVPAINALTAQLLNYGWQAPRLDYLKRVPRQGFDDGGVAAALQAIQNTVGAPRAARPTISASDLIGTSNWQGQSPGAYTDAGGQKISAPYVPSMAGGYPVFNFGPTAAADPEPDLMESVKSIYGRAAGGGVQGDVSYADDLPPIEIGRPHETPHAELPDITVGYPRPNYDRGESMRAYEPTTWERAAQWMMGDKAPSPERRAMVEGLMGTSGLGDEKMSAPQAAHLAAHFAPPTALPAAALDVGQMLYKGEVDPIDAILAGIAGAPGKYAKAAVAGAAGALAYPKEAQAGPAARALEVARRLNPFGHYSPAAEALAGIKQEKGRVGDFLNALKGRGVTDAELQHSGVADAFAPDERVTRDELADYFHSKLPKIEERIYGGAPLEHKPREIELEEVHGDDIPSWKTGHYELWPRGKSYTIEEAGGGRGPTEYYLHGPKGDNLGDYRTFDAAVQAAHDALAGRDAARYADYALPDAQRYREVVMHLPPSGAGASQGFKSNHWDEPNVLAHLRLADRTEMPSGETNVDILRRMQEAVGAKDWRSLGSGAPQVAVSKGLITPEEAAYISRVKGWRSGFEDKPGLEKKALHLEELQSDWGQKGRDEGFALGDGQLAPGYTVEEIPRYQYQGGPQIGSEFAVFNPARTQVGFAAPTREEALRSAIGGGDFGVPTGPYVTDTNAWTDLGLRRALKEAAEGDYDKLIWSPGQVHADRYDLSKHVNDIDYSPTTGKLTAWRPDGGIALEELNVSPERLPSFVGKDVARKILQSPQNASGVHNVTGDDLKVGGHGMLEYYDKVVPSRLKKMIQKMDPEAKMELFAHELPGTQKGKNEPVRGHVLHMTPALREAIKKGMPAFDKGGVVKQALNAISRYREPKSNYIKDWKWRPLRDVQGDIGTNQVPEHVQNFGHYMADISDKAATEGLDPEDLIKAYMITRSSIQREGRTPAKLASQGALMRETDEPLIRPEGQMAEWLQSPIGGRFLNDARRGDLSQDAVEAAMRVMKPFGMSKSEPDAMDWARRNLPDRTPLVSDLVARARVGESSPAEWREFTKDVRGIGPAKTGFIASLLGRGDLPTLDARQAILHTGMKNADVQDIMQKRAGRVGDEAVDRLAARQRALGFEMPEELSPFYQHLSHHTVWDAVGNEKTTHQDIIDAMQPRAAGGRAGFAGAGKVIRERLPIALADALNRIFHIEHPDPDVVQNALRTVEKWRIPDRPNPDKSGYYNIGQSRAPSDVTSQISAIRGLPLRKINKMTWQDFYDQAQGGTLINFGGDRSNFGRMKGMNGVPFAWDVDLHAGPKYALEPSRGSVWANDPGIATGFQNAIMRAAESGKPVYGVYTPMGPQAVNASHNMIDALLAQIPGRLASGELSHADARNFDAMLKAGEHAQSDKDVESLIKQMRDWPGLENAKEASEYMRPENVANGISGGNRRAFSLFMDTAPFKKQGFPMVGETRVGITDPALKFAPKSGAGHRIVRFNTDDLNPSSVAFKHSTYQQPTAGEYVGDVPLLPAHYVFGNALEKELQLLTRSGEVVHPLSADAQGRSSARKFIEEQNLLEPIDENFKRNIDLGLARKKAYGFREGGSIVDEALALLSRARRAA